MNSRFHVVLSLMLLSGYPYVTFSQWVQVIDSTTIVSFAVSPTNLFAGASEGPRITGFSVFSTTNNGLNWANVGNTIGGPNVNALAVNGVNLFAGTDGGYTGQGVYLSTNNGSNWALRVLNLPVYCLAVTETRLFAGTGSIVFLSTNNGTTWTEVNNGLPNTVMVSLCISGTNLFAGTDGAGVYRSTNDGANWTSASSGLTNSRVKVLSVNGNSLFAGTWGGGVFLTTDNGESWTSMNSGLTNTNVFALAVSGTTLFAGTGLGGGVFLSTDSGTIWTSVNDGLLDTFVLALAVSDGNLFAGTWRGGIWRRPLSELVSVKEPHAIVPQCFSVEQNYPNPFNPTTRIAYDLPVAGHVKMSVFDVVGREVATPVDEEQQPGFKSVEFASTRFASGVYFYRLSAGTFISTKKMMVLK